MVISPQLADVLSTIITRIRGTGLAVPLVAAYDDHERVWLPPAPVLFQRRIGAENRAIPAATIRYPRAVNNLAISSLLAAFTAGKAIVDETSARAAVTEVTTE